MTAHAVASAAPAPSPLQAGFTALLPALRRAARKAFAGRRCPHDRADAEAEAVALAWQRFRQEQRPGELAADELAAFAVGLVLAGASLCQGSVFGAEVGKG
jgi:hypothetical protein